MERRSKMFKKNVELKKEKDEKKRKNIFLHAKKPNEILGFGKI
ncbi:hypothetical protein FUSO5_08090 [Fusobacterium necrophorum BFTR-1]|nr:hypothetical protein FUSO5_08090 [Fusobacterium necrophorum BFTR-1]